MNIFSIIMKSKPGFSVCLILLAVATCSIVNQFTWAMEAPVEGAKATSSKSVQARSDSRVASDQKKEKKKRKKAGKQSQPKEHACEDCDKTFPTHSKLIVHMRIHTGEKPFKCSECDKAFSANENLTKHIRTHTGEKPFKCSECNKGFRQNCHLIKHMLSHAEKKFKCEECDKSFADDARLSGHMLSHTGEKRFKCTQCGKGFSSKNSCARHQHAIHQQIHTGKSFQCEICRKVFGYKSTLTTHMRSHTGEKPFKCTQCTKDFSDRSNFNKHMRTHTKKKTVRSTKSRKRKVSQKGEQIDKKAKVSASEVGYDEGSHVASSGNDSDDGAEGTLPSVVDDSHTSLSSSLIAPVEEESESKSGASVLESDFGMAEALIDPMHLSAGNDSDASSAIIESSSCFSSFYQPMDLSSLTSFNYSRGVD